MASSYIVRRSGGRWQVRYRLGGRESRIRYGGSFRTLREARARRDWIAGELAALRVPALEALTAADRAPAETVRTAAEAWRASRLDVAAGTDATYAVSLGRILPVLGSLELDRLDTRRVARFVAELAEGGLARESIRKTLGVLAMVLDHASVTPNPARDRVTVRLPRRELAELAPPTGDALEAVVTLLPSSYRLPVVVLDATGMRVGELEALRWADIDEPRGRWRVSAATSKTSRPRWVTPPADVFAAVIELLPREDRELDALVFEGFAATRLRTAIGRACRAAGVPLFSPHDLRHRRISLLHLGGVPWARIGEAMGQRSLAITADTYTHVLADERELDYAELLKEKRATIARSLR
jgi:integrase